MEVNIIKAHNNAWHLFDCLTANPLKTGGQLPYYSWIKDTGEYLLWPNRLYRLAPGLSDSTIEEIANQIHQDVYPGEIQICVTKRNESNITALLKQGFFAQREFPAMSVTNSYQSMEHSFHSDLDVRVKAISNTSELRDWAGLLGTGFWADKPDVSEPMYDLYQPIYQNKAVLQLFISYVNGSPAATSMAFLSPESGGIYLVYVKQEYRKHGLGALVTQTAMQWCFSQGRDKVILQATAMGEPVYKRIGFKVDFNYIILVPSFRV